MEHALAADQACEQERLTALVGGWKSRFLAQLSHEVRTPLTGIVGMTDLLLESPLTEEQREFAGIIKACAGEMLEILNRALELADLSLGDVDLHKEEFRLDETLRTAAAPHPFELEPGLPQVVLGDALHLRQLVSQMVESASRHSPSSKIWVRVSGEVAASLLRLTLCVAQQGLTQEHADLLQSYAAQPEAAAPAGPPPGNLEIGWAIVQRIACLMNGSFSLVLHPRVGCVCKVVLPLELPPEEQSPAPPAGWEPILLVEDNEVARRVVIHLLKRRQFQVECALDGPHALALAARRRFCAVLMDLQLPGMDGFEAARRLRSLPGYSDVPILALTANVTEDYRRLCLDSGMAGFIPKPVEAADLFAALAAAGVGLTSPQG